MAKARIYLCLQEFNDGRVMFRRWSPDYPGTPPGGQYQTQSLDAHLWIQRMVYQCAKKSIVPPVKWTEAMPFADEFLKTIKPFDSVDADDNDAALFVQDLRDNGFDEARFV